MFYPVLGFYNRKWCSSIQNRMGIVEFSPHPCNATRKHFYRYRSVFLCCICYSKSAPVPHFLETTSAIFRSDCSLRTKPAQLHFRLGFPNAKLPQWPEHFLPPTECSTDVHCLKPEPHSDSLYRFLPIIPAANLAGLDRFCFFLHHSGIRIRLKPLPQHRHFLPHL